MRASNTCDFCEDKIKITKSDEIILRKVREDTVVHVIYNLACKECFIAKRAAMNLMNSISHGR